MRRKKAHPLRRMGFGNSTNLSHEHSAQERRIESRERADGLEEAIPDRVIADVWLHARARSDNQVDVIIEVDVHGRDANAAVEALIEDERLGDDGEALAVKDANVRPAARSRTDGDVGLAILIEVAASDINSAVEAGIEGEEAL